MTPFSRFFSLLHTRVCLAVLSHTRVCLHSVCAREAVSSCMRKAYANTHPRAHSKESCHLCHRTLFPAWVPCLPGPLPPQRPPASGAHPPTPARGLYTHPQASRCTVADRRHQHHHGTRADGRSPMRPPSGRRAQRAHTGRRQPPEASPSGAPAGRRGGGGDTHALTYSQRSRWIMCLLPASRVVKWLTSNRETAFTRYAPVRSGKQTFGWECRPG